MKKTIFLFLLFLAVYGAVHVKAQVRIGGGSAAHPSSILDLNPSDTTTAGGGLLLPRVHLDSITDIDVFGVNPLRGLMVYNLNDYNDRSYPAEGIYCYDGEKWLPVNPSTPKYEGQFEITMPFQHLWMGNDGELTKLLDITFSELPNEDDLGGCTMEYIGYLADLVEGKVIEFALTPDLQIANVENTARVYFQIANIRDRIVKGRIYELHCEVRVSRYTSNRVSAGYVVYGTGTWLGDRRWLNVAPANVGATIQSLPAQLDHTPDDGYDPAVYGDLYQWGRKKDGHQLRTADTTGTFKTDTEGVPVNVLDDANGQIQGVDSGKFILRANEAKDWRAYPAGDPDNSITFPKTAWTWADPANNPCDSAEWRLPTAEEWAQIFNRDNNTLVWKDGGANGVSGYEIKPEGIARPTSFFLPAAGRRNSDDGLLSDSSGNYWSSTTHGDFSLSVSFDGDNQIALENRNARAHGFSVRCVADGGGSMLEPELPEYTGGPFTFMTTSEQIWMGRGDAELKEPPTPVSLTFGSGFNYRADFVWYFYEKNTMNEWPIRMVTAGPELRMSATEQGMVEGGYDVWPEGARLEEGKVYLLTCHVMMGENKNFESHTIDAGYAVYGTGAWIGPGKWLNVANANVGANQAMTLSGQLTSNHIGYNQSVMGDYFQWGRAADGHQLINSDTVRSIVPAAQLDGSGTPIGDVYAGKFILSDTVSDWRYPDNLSSDAEKKKWYWRTKEDPNTGIDPCNMEGEWFVMTLSHWDSIREHNRLAWLDTDVARGVAVYPNGSDDVSFYFPISGARDYCTGNLYPDSDNDWRNTWATGIWLNTPVPETSEIDKASAKAIGLTWSSGSDPKINIGSSNARVSGLPIRCVRNSD